MATNNVGSVMACVSIPVHPALSVIVTEYVPAVNPLIEAEVAPVFHKNV